MAIKAHSVGDDIRDLTLGDVLEWKSAKCICLVYGCKPALQHDWYLVLPGIPVDARTATKSDQEYKRIELCFGKTVKIKNDPKLVVN